jgi:hypothetical protein
MGKPDAANEAQNNAKSLNADASAKESSFDIPGFEAAAGIMALCVMLLIQRKKE